MADIPPPPDTTTPQTPTTAALIAAMNPYATVNLEEAKKQKEQYGEELKATRGALSQAGARREDITQRNLRAIDESIQGIKDSRTGTYGLDPAVTAALAAGLLKPTGGGGFLAELGQGMANVAPVVAGLQTKDRDSYALLAELHRKRGDFEAEPVKEEQVDLRAREKLEMANLKEAEKALARAPNASAATAANKDANEKEKIKNDLLNKTEAEIKSYTEDRTDANGNPLTDQQKESIRRYVRHRRIVENNFGKKPGDPYYIDPGVSGMEESDEVTAKHLMANSKPLLKGNDKAYDDYVRAFRSQSRNDGQEPDPREIWEAKNKGNAAFQQQQAKDDQERLDKSGAIFTTNKNTTDTVDRLLQHPGLEKVVGISPLTRFLPNMSGEALSFVQQMQHFKSELFLQGVAQMKGMGQLSDAEGKKLEAAIAAVGTAQTPEAFRAELQRVKQQVASYEAAVRQDLANIKRRRGIDQPKPPEVGEVRDGHRFKGGNPGDPKNWEPI